MKTQFPAETDGWKIRIDEKEFDRLKKEERFWFLVTLARAVNAFRFVHSALEPVKSRSSRKGETMDELEQNVLDAVRCHFDLEMPREVIFLQPRM